MKTKSESGLTNPLKLKHLQKDLEFLHQVTYFREDFLLFHKLILLQKNKKKRNMYLNKFLQLQASLQNTQSIIVRKYSKQYITDPIKNLLFHYSSKIYKTIKYFYMKIINYWPNYLQVSQSSSFIQQVRKFSIEILSINNNESEANDKNKIKATISDFLSVFQRQLKQKFQRQLNLMQTERIFPNQSSIKSQKFIQLLDQIDHIFKFYEMAQFKLKKQIQDFYQNQNVQSKSKIDKFTANCCRLIKINEDKNSSESYNKFLKKSKKDKNQIYQTQKMQQEILDLEHQTKANTQIINSYKQEGILQFYMNKQSRMLKELMSKNLINQKYINNFREKNRKSINSTELSHFQGIKDQKKVFEVDKSIKNTSKNLDNRNLFKIKQKYLTLQNDSCRNSYQMINNAKNSSNKIQENFQSKEKQQQCLSIKEFVLNTQKNQIKNNCYKFKQPLTLRLSTKQDKRQNSRQQNQSKKQRTYINQRSNYILKQVRQALYLFVENYSDKQNTLKIDLKQQRRKLNSQIQHQRMEIIQADFLRCKNKRYRITSIPQNRSFKIRPIQPQISILQEQITKNMSTNNQNNAEQQKQNQQIFISKTVKYQNKGQCLVLDEFALKQKINNYRL